MATDTIGPVSDSLLESWAKNMGEPKMQNGNPLSFLISGTVSILHFLAQTHMLALRGPKWCSGRPMQAGGTHFFAYFWTLGPKTWVSGKNVKYKLSLKLEKKVGYHFAFLPQTHILGPRFQKWIWNWASSCPLAPTSQNMSMIKKYKIETAPKIRKECGLPFCIFGSDPYFGHQGRKMNLKLGPLVSVRQARAGLHKHHFGPPRAKI